MTNELATRDNGAALAVMPVMDLAQAGDRYNAMTAFVRGLMHDGSDFGVIPGTNGKPVLLKPGAEKLCTFFGLSKRFVLAQSIEDWTGDTHGGEPFFYYLYRCQLWRGDLLVAESDGSCNSRESKYRWRKSERVCPACGQPTIIKGRAEYGGGWLCFAKKGGCGAKYGDGDPDIEGQATGRVANPDIADQVNTVQKMAQKRALIGTTLLAVNASEFFTQDMEDFVDAEVVTTTARQLPPTVAHTAALPSNGASTVPDTGTTGNGQHSASTPADDAPDHWTPLIDNTETAAALHKLLVRIANKEPDDYRKTGAIRHGAQHLCAIATGTELAKEADWWEAHSAPLAGEVVRIWRDQAARLAGADLEPADIDWGDDAPGGEPDMTAGEIDGEILAAAHD